MTRLIPFIIVLALLSCDHQTKKNHRGTMQIVFSQKLVKTTIPKATKVIHILPLGYVPTEYINEIQSTVKKFYGYDCVILPQVEPTDDIMAASNMRYEASRILNKYNTNEYRLIITEEDIAYKSVVRQSTEWGIFGLGNMPGTTSVVSTFRLKRNVAKEVFLDRLDKIVLHELGHNLSLDHCTNNPQCMMNAANGAIKQVDQEKIWFCDRCRKLLK